MSLLDEQILPSTEDTNPHTLLAVRWSIFTVCRDRDGRAAPQTKTPFRQFFRKGSHRPYELKLEELKYVFGPLPPVMRVQAGDIIDTTTVDADGKALEAAGLKVVGPILSLVLFMWKARAWRHSRSAISDHRSERQRGFGGAGPGFGALNSSHYTPMLGESIPTKSWVYPIDTAEKRGDLSCQRFQFSVKIPLHPFLGCVGVAPADGEARSSIVPRSLAATWMLPEASVGNTLYLPVNVPGALLFSGTDTAQWVTEKSPARPLRCQCTCV